MYRVYYFDGTTKDFLFEGQAQFECACNGGIKYDRPFGGSTSDDNSNSFFGWDDKKKDGWF